MTTESLTRPATLRILLLGGTAEAVELARRLDGRGDLVVISSLAGRTRQPIIPPGRVRIGGFGGVEGLVRFLHDRQINVVVDATHPFAATMSANASAACERAAVPLLTFARAPWIATEADRWIMVPDVESAACCVARTGGRVFLTIGRQKLGLFSACDTAWFLIRTIDPPEAALPKNASVILHRGPFDLADELRLLREHAIDYVVSKNSGGSATAAKIEAARVLGLPVVMVQPPYSPGLAHAASVDDVLAALNRLQQRSAD